MEDIIDDDDIQELKDDIHEEEDIELEDSPTDEELLLLEEETLCANAVIRGSMARTADNGSRRDLRIQT
jgi:hypothetical protein